MVNAQHLIVEVALNQKSLHQTSNLAAKSQSFDVTTERNLSVSPALINKAAGPLKPPEHIQLVRETFPNLPSDSISRGDTNATPKDVHSSPERPSEHGGKQRKLAKENKRLPRASYANAVADPSHSNRADSRH